MHYIQLSFHIFFSFRKTEKESVTILGIIAALVTDAHQSIEAQKGNPPSWAHHPVFAAFLVVNKKKNKGGGKTTTLQYSRERVRLLSLGKLGAVAGGVFSAVPRSRGHRCVSTPSASERTESPRSASADGVGRREEGGRRKREGRGDEDRGRLLKAYSQPEDHRSNGRRFNRAAHVETGWEAPFFPSAPNRNGRIRERIGR